MNDLLDLPEWVNQPTPIPEANVSPRQWRPVGALVFSILGLIGAIPMTLRGLWVAAAGLLSTTAPMLASGLFAVAAGCAVGVPMTMYLFRPAKRSFIIGVVAMAAVPVLLVLLVFAATLYTNALFATVAA